MDLFTYLDSWSSLSLARKTSVNNNNNNNIFYTAQIQLYSFQMRHFDQCASLTIDNSVKQDVLLDIGHDNKFQPQIAADYVLRNSLYSYKKVNGLMISFH